MRKIIKILITLMLFFISSSITSAYTYKQVDLILGKTYQRIDKNTLDVQEKINKLEDIKKRIEKIYKIKGNNKNSKNKEFLLLMILSLNNKIKFYKEILESENYSNLINDDGLDDDGLYKNNKNEINVINVINFNFKRFKMAYNDAPVISSFFKLEGEGFKKVNTFEILFKYNCDFEINKPLKDIYLKKNKFQDNIPLLFSGTIKYGNKCETKYYIKNHSFELGKKYSLNIKEFDSIIFGGKFTDLDVYINNFTGFNYNKDIPYIKYDIYDNEIGKFKFSGLYNTKITSIGNEIDKIGEIKINTNSSIENYKITHLSTKFNIKINGHKINDESILSKVYFVDNFGKIYGAKRLKGSNGYLPGPIYSIESKLENNKNNINNNISKVDVYANLSKIIKSKNEQIEIEISLRDINIKKKGYLYKNKKIKK